MKVTRRVVRALRAAPLALALAGCGGSAPADRPSAAGADAARLAFIEVELDREALHALGRRLS